MGELLRSHNRGFVSIGSFVALNDEFAAVIYINGRHIRTINSQSIYLPRAARINVAAFDPLAPICITMLALRARTLAR